MKYKNLYLFGLLLALAAAIIFKANVASANPSYFLPTVQTATATSTVAFMTPGTGTTTLAFDSYQNGQFFAIDNATLLTQYVASSTSSILGISIQYSNDGIDWYSDNYLAQSASTTSSVNLANPIAYTWKAAGTATSSTALKLSVPMRYVRAIYSATGANLSIWSQIVPSRQTI